MFSDLIFGLSLSISAVTLIGSQVFTVPNIVNRIIAFVFNFVVLIMIWLRYTGTMAILPIETGQVIFLNLFLLLLVGLEPFLLILIQDTLFIPGMVTSDSDSIARFAASLYALDLAGLVAIQGFFTHILSIEERGIVPSHLIHSYRVARNAQFMLSMVFVVSVLPQLWSVQFLGLPLPIQLWWIPLFGSVVLMVGKYGFGAPTKG